MFGGFKKFFSKEAEAPAVTPAAPPPVSPPAARPVSPSANPVAAAPAARPAPRPAPPPGERVQVPFKAILAKLPSNLAALVKAPASGTFPLPVATAVSQLITGAVRVPFGDLRAAAPAGTFADNASQDETMVDLPLADVLPLINPALLPKRTGQKRVFVSEDVTSIFGPKDKGGKPSTAAQVAAPIVGKEPPPPEPAPVAKAPEPAPAPAAPSAPIAMPTISMPAPIAMPKPSAPISMPPPKAPTPPPPAMSAPVAPKPPTPAPAPTFTPKPAPTAAPAPVAAAAPAAPAVLGDMVIPLADVTQAWPEPLKQEIEKAGLQGAKLLVPMSLVEPMMRAGRVNFTWADLSKWMEPAPSFSFAPETVLDLPLKTIIPMFMAQRRTGGVQRKVNIAESIPDLFGGSKAPAPAPVAAPAPAPAPIPAPVPVATPAPSAPPVAMPTISFAKPSAPPSAPPAAKPADDGGEVIAALNKANWSPKDVVQTVCALKGVAGSLVAMSDGLSVAAQMPPTLKSDNMAAFLPQIFGRMNQYAKEMELGDLSSITLVMGDAPCAIFKTGAIYLVVLGRANESLPDALLKRIAAELAKRNP